MTTTRTASTDKAATTRQRLIDASERLFAAHGVDDVSVAQITAAAGQRNAAAVHYHFGGRQGLLDALLERHHEQIDAIRFAQIAGLERPTIRELVYAIVDPMLDQLDTDSGRSFLKIQCDRFIARGVIDDRLAPSMEEVSRQLADLVAPAPTAIRVERARLAALLVNVRLGQEASSVDPADRVVLRQALVTAVSAVLSAPAEHDS